MQYKCGVKDWPFITAKGKIRVPWQGNKCLVYISGCGAGTGQGTPMSGTGGAPHSPSNANSTLSRPMASTGGTRYEDRTIRRHREVNTAGFLPPKQDGGSSFFEMAFVFIHVNFFMLLAPSQL
jgi:hypothetical protein